MRPFPSDAALRHAVGGDFEAMGAMQVAILEHYGLRPDSALVDVGCGVGRLTSALAGRHTGPYLGTDANATSCGRRAERSRPPTFVSSA